MTKAKSDGLLRGDLSATDIINALDFAEEHIEVAARNLPKLYVETAKHNVRCTRTVIELHSRLDVMRVDLSMAARRRFSAKDMKATEAMVKEDVDSQESVRKLRTELSEAELSEQFSKLLLEAVRMKKSAVQAVTSLAGAEYALEKKIVHDRENDKLVAQQRKLANSKYRTARADTEV